MDFSRTFEPAGKGCWVSVRSQAWDGPFSFSQRPIYNHLCLCLPPIDYHGRIRFPEAGTGTAHQVGRSFFYPAGHLIEGWASGGHSWRFRCLFSQKRVSEMLETDQPWKVDEIERGSNLEDSAVFPLLSRMATEMRMPGMAHGVLMESLFNNVVVELARFLGQRHDMSARGHLSPTQLRQIEERVRNEELAPPSVAELAAMAGMSERHLLRLFRATTGRTISSFIRNELVARACRLLKENKLSLKQIAYVLGFASPSSFSPAFRKATGMAPAQYRNMHFRGVLN